MWRRRGRRAPSTADILAQPTGVDPAVDVATAVAVYGSRWLWRTARRRQQPADPRELPRVSQETVDTGNVRVLPPDPPPPVR